MIGNILKSVTECEEKADELIKDAEREGKMMIEEAKLKAEAMKKEMADTIKSENQDMLKEIQSVGGEELEKAVLDAAKEADNLRLLVKEKEKIAVEAVISQMIS